MLLHRGRSKERIKDDHSSKVPGPSFMTPQQVGQQPFASTTNRSSSPLKFFSSSTTTQPDKSKDLQKAWTADFLTNLRSNRPARPSGSRPLPTRQPKDALSVDPPPRPISALSRPMDSSLQAETGLIPVQERSASSMSHRRAQSALSMREHAGTPLAKQPTGGVTARDFSSSAAQPGGVKYTTPDNAPPSIQYYERGQRWMEKQEAKSLRVALEDMDLLEEQRIHAAAQDEAAELVWKHRNSGVPYRNPEVIHDYKQHLRKGSHARSQSISRYGVLGKELIERTQRTVSDGSNSTKSKGDSSVSSRVSSGSSYNQGRKSSEDPQKDDTNESAEQEASKKKGYEGLIFPLPSIKASSLRRRSRSRSRNISGEARQSLFSNPEDKIYEEPEDTSATQQEAQETAAKSVPLKPKSRNTSATYVKVKNVFERPASVNRKRFSEHEIGKQPPSQSRDPAYKRNATFPDPSNNTNENSNGAGEAALPMKNGLEIRSDEIRAATSMRLKDRSPKLPIPTVVSDRPGRPIVSFDRNYRPREVELNKEESKPTLSSNRVSWDNTAATPSKNELPTSTTSAPAIPTINISESPIPSINICDVPSISVSDTCEPAIPPLKPSNSSRPLPFTTRSEFTPHGHRPLPHHSSTAPIPSNRGHWTPIPQRATAQCYACALPISGRIVSAASQRFHPACFSCHQCGELLECVAFYPESDTFRDARLARISARLNNEPLSAEDACHTEESDGDDSLRFYCHLDFHENFSPRCRSCKTPIEGEVVVACGGEWHVGHFFCAECGDPFDASTPFVEKDGFAWCVDCHTRRFSGKCAGCRKPIMDMVVKALGREWHDTCFCCKVQ
jgi:paxillin